MPNDQITLYISMTDSELATEWKKMNALIPSQIDYNGCVYPNVPLDVVKYVTEPRVYPQYRPTAPLTPITTPPLINPTNSQHGNNSSGMSTLSLLSSSTMSTAAASSSSSAASSSSSRAHGGATNRDGHGNQHTEVQQVIHDISRSLSYV